jgi:Mn2+/Fe2+ NRAMP family transporter
MSTLNRQSVPWRHVLAAIGPGLAVMLADTESGSVITVAQSGAQWGYRLLLLQMVLIVPLYMVQELAARLALSSGKGYAELVRQHFGRGPALAAVVTLMISCLGSLVTQLGGLAGIGQLFGVPIWQTLAVLIAAILLIVATGSYHAVERTIIVFGLFELAFLVVAWRAHPDAAQIREQLVQFPLTDPGYLYLVAANLGTSVMPWAVFYQQSALIDKGLGAEDASLTRVDLLLGAVLCQVITAALLIAAAATFGQHQATQLESVPQIASAFTAALGDVGRIVFVAGVGGGSLVAIIVICLAAAWALGEVSGVGHSLEQHPFEAPWFYGGFAVLLLAGAGFIAAGIDVVRLSIAVGVVNALLLPVVLGFLYRLARTELNKSSFRLSGPYAALAALVFTGAALLGLYASLVGVFG